MNQLWKRNRPTTKSQLLGGTSLLSLFILGLRILNHSHKIIIFHCSFIRAIVIYLNWLFLRFNKGLPQISPNVRTAVLLIILDNLGSTAGATWGQWKLVQWFNRMRIILKHRLNLVYFLRQRERERIRENSCHYELFRTTWEMSVPIKNSWAKVKPLWLCSRT